MPDLFTAVPYITLALAAASAVFLFLLLLRKPPGPDPRLFEDAARRALGDILRQASHENKALREEIDGKLDRLKETQLAASAEFSRATSAGLESIRGKLEERLDMIRAESRRSLADLQSSNEKKLDEMRQTVNEKLEKTLESRLQKSFETVSAQLESVNKGLGEMKTVAESVGSLNRVLAGTKARGILGELQLGQIIEDMLPAHLYEREAAVTEGSRERVDYAVKLPGSEEGRHVYLPIDSKFPLEDYYRLVDGYENGDRELIETARGALFQRIKAFARDVKRKYVSPPDTTSFAVIFLPTEGLYSEIARDAAFFDALRRDGIIITGPTTLAAMLNSLQIGFKTLQIQRGAAEIEKTLGAVKREFEAFEGILKKAHDKITQAGGDIEKLVGVRTRAINRTLREVQTYTGGDIRLISDEGMSENANGSANANSNESESANSNESESANGSAATNGEEGAE